MNCPACEHPDAYKGLLWIHCKNSDCRYFDARYVEQLKSELSNLSKVDRLIMLRDLLEKDDS